MIYYQQILFLQMKSNIVLIGMPGVGKSTAGVVAAKLAGFQFLDTDLVIMQRDGRLLRDIIEQDGVEGFLAIENEVNASIDASNTIIATGGSVIFGDEAMAHLADIGTIVYLRASYETVASRVTNLKGRGVAMKPGQTLRNIYDERKALYEKFADRIIDVDTQSIESTAQHLAAIRLMPTPSNISLRGPHQES